MDGLSYVEEEEFVEEDQQENTSHVTASSSSQKRIFIDNLSNHIKIGIIGTVNVGKSTLFNCLTQSSKFQSLVDNALFTTIDPYTATFTPFDARMNYLVEQNPEVSKITPSKLTVIDTAGIIKGSFREKKGVGITSLESLYQTDVLLHVIKCFDSDKIAHYYEEYHPLQTLQMIEQELLQMDLYQIEQRLHEIEYFIDDSLIADQLLYQYQVILKAWEWIAGESRPSPPHTKNKNIKKMHRTKLPSLCTGSLIRLGPWDIKEKEVLSTLKLLTSKETVYLLNVRAIDYNRHRITKEEEEIKQFLSNRKDPSIQTLQISLELEQRMYDLAKEQRLLDYLKINPKHVSMIPFIIQEIYIILQLIHYYTISMNEIKCWVLRQGSTVVDAALKDDIFVARNFIRADILAFEDYYAYNADRLQLSMEGKIRGEGRKYILNDGDIVSYITHPGNATASLHSSSLASRK